MARFLALILLAVDVLALILFAPAARAVEDPTEALNAERDALIEKIRDGKDWQASVARFKELLEKRDAAVATTTAAREHEREAREKERAAREEIYNRRRAYEDTADYDVSWRCTLSPDPAHPIPSQEGRFRGDWGPVVRKQAVRYAPKNELDEGEPAVLYEIRGQKQTYVVRGEHHGWGNRHDFVAEKGDLVLVCDSGDHMEQRLPVGWGNKLTGGFAVRLAETPRIAKKARWQPIHITSSALFWVVHDVKWKWPDDAFLLYNLEIEEDLGQGRYKIAAEQNKEWIMEVPPSVRVPVKLQPGQRVWAILGHHRFDKQLKMLVLVAEDLEEHYVKEKM